MHIHSHTCLDTHLECYIDPLSASDYWWEPPPTPHLPTSQGQADESEFTLSAGTQEGMRDAECLHCAPPVPSAAVWDPLGLPCRATVTCGNSPAPPGAPGCLPGSLRSRVEPEGWSLSPCTQPSFHHLPFTQRLAYPHFFFFCCLCNEKLSTRSLIKFYAYPTPIPQIPAKKKKGRLKPGTHLAKGTLVNKKVTHHGLQVTPPVILNPLPGDLPRLSLILWTVRLQCWKSANWT